MQVIAVKEIRYAQVNHSPGGEPFEVSDKDAKILVAIGKVAPYIAPKPRAKPSEPAVEKTPAKGKYSRRDMRA